MRIYTNTDGLLEAKRDSEVAEAGELQLRLLPVNAGIIVPEYPEPQRGL
jgi:hypothetical protein